MQALEITAYNENLVEAIQSLRIVQRPIPTPSEGELLIRVEAAPCNPSDLLFLQGRYGKRKTLPAIPGWEGAGTVIAAGKGTLPWWLQGKRVAFSVQSDRGGTWAQYAVANAKQCIPLKKQVSFEQGACLIINPLTALGLVEEAGQQAIIQTAAASQVGKMVLTLAKERGIPVIHVVRREEQKELLTTLGADIVLNSESPHFEKELQEQANRLQATIAFEAVGGTMTGRILRAMPPCSKVVVYGSLSGSSCGDISPLDLIFKEKSVCGFFLSSWIAKKWVWDLYHSTNLIQTKITEGSIHTSISEKISLEEAPKALIAYQKEMTAGKVIIKPFLQNSQG